MKIPDPRRFTGNAWRVLTLRSIADWRFRIKEIYGICAICGFVSLPSRLAQNCPDPAPHSTYFTLLTIPRTYAYTRVSVSDLWRGLASHQRGVRVFQIPDSGFRMAGDSFQNLTSKTELNLGFTTHQSVAGILNCGTTGLRPKERAEQVENKPNGTNMLVIKHIAQEWKKQTQR